MTGFRIETSEQMTFKSFLSTAFIASAGGILLISGLAKLLSGIGKAEVLEILDPIFSIKFRFVFWIVGGIEVVIALVCAFGDGIKLRASLIAWLGTSFIGYRLCLKIVGWRKPCPCLGNLTDILHISPQTADIAMKVILAYLVIGSYATLFWLWRQKRKAATSPSGMPVSTT